MRLVRMVDHGVAELIDSLGSGDLVSLGKSSGFVEIPPGDSGEGPWPYVAWA
jgi:molybdopterin molybdotransferase